LKKIGRGNQKIGIIRVVCTLFCRNSADYRAKCSTTHPDNTYLLIPSTDFFQDNFFGKLMDHTITGYAQISWQPIYNINKAVAFRDVCDKKRNLKKSLYNWGLRIADFTTVYEANSRRL
jgi:hypothetical protein